MIAPTPLSDKKIKKPHNTPISEDDTWALQVDDLLGVPPQLIKDALTMTETCNTNNEVVLYSSQRTE